MKRLRSKLTYANVISTLCLFLLVGGGSALAASKLAENSVGAKQLKKSSVTASKIKKNAITSSKIADGSISGSKIQLGSLGTVPSATNATNAVNATHASTADTANAAANAGTVNGQTVTKIFSKLVPGQGKTTIASIAGFTVLASCPVVVGEEVLVELSAPPGVGSVLTSLSSSDGGANALEEYDSGTTATIQLNNGYLGHSTFSGATTNGTVVTGNIGFDDPNTLNNEDVCVVFGQVTSG